MQMNGPKTDQRLLKHPLLKKQVGEETKLKENKKPIGKQLTIVSHGEEQEGVEVQPLPIQTLDLKTEETDLPDKKELRMHLENLLLYL